MASAFPVSKSLIAGEAGAIEIAAHVSETRAPVAIAVVAHPHPLFGGTMDNKVATTLARALFDAGAATFRFNFRGVGGTEGTHDEGRGETADLLTVVAHAGSMYPGVPLWMSGFSFGAAVTLAASEQIQSEEMVLVAPGFSADCLETLEELDGENRHIFEGNGGEKFAYLPALNDSLEGIDVIEAIVRRELMGWI